MDPPRRPPPALMEELVEEILLRFPPDDPASLFRAALVCKNWCRLVSGAGFRRRFREVHRTAPMLGFLQSFFATANRRGLYGTGFMPTSSFRLPRAINPSWRAMDALHGRILFYNDVRCRPMEEEMALIVLNPITNQERKLPRIPLDEFRFRISAALLCANHLNCGDGCGPLDVVVVGINPLEACWSTCVYSSEQDAWSEPVYGGLVYIGDFFIRGPGVRVAIAIYFVCESKTIVIKYDVGRKGLSFVNLPTACQDCCIALMTTEDGRLGFSMAQGSKLHMWSRRVDQDGCARWSQQRVIELDSLHSDYPLTGAPKVLVVADGVGVIFIKTLDGLFTVDLMSGRVRKLCHGYGYIGDIVPFVSFCTPAWARASTGEEPKRAVLVLDKVEHSVD